MAFVLEDGTGISNANSYANEAELDAYLDDRGVTKPAGNIDALLVRATDYIEMRWGAKFAGTKLVSTQRLSFPRGDLDEYPGVPECLKNATIEYAVRAASGSLAPDPVFDTTGRRATKTKRKVGPIETETQYAENGAGAIAPLFRPYPLADSLLRPLLAPGALGGRVYR